MSAMREMTLGAYRSFTGAAAILAALVFAGGETRADTGNPLPSLVVPFAKTTPQVTAQPDDPAWSGPASVRLDKISINTKEPLLSHPIPGTEIRTQWDAKYLYFRFTCQDDGTPCFPPPGGQVFQADAVELFIDPVGDAREWIELEFNARNDRLGFLTLCTAQPKYEPDLRLTGDFVARDVWTFPLEELSQVRSAAKWNPENKTWLVDVAIPASALLKRTGKKKFEPMQLRANLMRYKYVAEASGSKHDLLSLNWSAVPLGSPHRCPEVFGYLQLTAPNPSQAP